MAVLHDLNHACRYGTHIIAMKDGAVVAEGPPAEIITEELVQEVFGMACRIIDDPVSHTPLVIPLGRERQRNIEGAKVMTLVLDAQVTDTEWAQIVDRISRRRFFGGAAGVAAALALSACGSSDGESDSASDTLPYTWAEFSGDVPRDPKRVVVLDGRVDLEFAMMMDYPIVGSGNFWFPDAKAGFQFPGRTIEDASFVNVAGDFSTNFEALLALEPDLIVITAIGYTSDWYGTERLSSIAPLLVVGDDVEPIAGHPVD